MIPARRIAILYRKELLEILRDRRTLIAMIVIPVVLYPLLMLWLIWETQSEHQQLQQEVFTIEVADLPTRQNLEQIIQIVRPEHFPNRDRQGAHPDLSEPRPSGSGPSPSEPRPSGSGYETQPSTESRPTFNVRVGQTPDADIGPEVQLRVALTHRDQPPPLPPHLEVRIDFNDVNVLSRTAKDELVYLLNDFRSQITRQSIRQILQPAGPHDPTAPFLAAAVDRDIDLILQPVQITATPTASQRQRGGWALGQIIPVLLVLMIVTGAIYPAVDLTAGERERGTLETLMAAPVPPLHLIVGKFLVVATIALITAALNLASVGATMHFGGISRLITGTEPIEFPLAVLPLILLCMVPLSLLAAALLTAVCSFARTFKEAQNYSVPVIIVTLVACVPVSMETARLEGSLLILPVGNMVLLARDLLQQTCSFSAAVVVLLSTTLYAAAAIALAARLFGQEAVLFADTGSFKTLIRRRLFQPTPYPTTAQAFLLAALLFPVCFYGQLGLMGDSIDQLIPMLKRLALWQFVGLFVLLPLALCLYFRINLRRTFRLRLPTPSAWLAVILLGLSSWAVAQEFVRLQHRLLPPSQTLTDAARQMDAQLESAPLLLVFLLLAAIPAICEETLFRGFVLSGLATGLKKWPAILASAAVFATFHFMVDRIPLTFLLGTLLAYICWQTRSLLPAVLFHLMHNGSMLLLPRVPALADRLGLSSTSPEIASPPLPILLAAALLFAAGLTLLARRFPSPSPDP